MTTDRPIEKSKALVLLIPATPWPSYMLDDVRKARELGRPIIAVLRSGYTMPDGLDDAVIVRADTPAEMADKIKKVVEGSAEPPETRCPNCDSGKRSHRGFAAGDAPIPCGDPWHLAEPPETT